MDTKTANKLRRAMKSCESCDVRELPKISELRDTPDLVMWASRRESRKKIFEQLVDVSRLTILVGDSGTCQRHRDRIIRKLGVLFEIELVPDGSTDAIVPTCRKSHAWFTLYWKSPETLTEEEANAWVGQGRKLGQMIRGQERLPKMPKKLRGLTYYGNLDQFNYELESRGYSRVHSRVIGEDILVVRDDEVQVPKGKATDAAHFTLDECLRLRHFVGMKPNPEMIRGVWLLKKHLGVSVIQ